MPLEPYFAELIRNGRPARPEPPALPAGVTVASLEIPGPHGPVPVRTYRPAGAAGATLLWVHGGGFRHGDLDMPEAHLVSAELASRAGAYVVSVGYRLAVDGVRYPVPLDDVFAAWGWASAGDGRPPQPRGRRPGDRRVPRLLRRRPPRRMRSGRRPSASSTGWPAETRVGAVARSFTSDKELLSIGC